MADPLLFLQYTHEASLKSKSRLEKTIFKILIFAAQDITYRSNKSLFFSEVLTKPLSLLV